MNYDNLSVTKKKALNSFQKKYMVDLNCMTDGCTGDYYAKGKCKSCYNKYNAKSFDRKATFLLKNISGLDDIDNSSLNPNRYQEAECKVDKCSGTAITTYPFCEDCLSVEHGLRVSQSTIPGVGFGLFADKDFDRNHTFNLIYGDGKHILDKEAFDAFIAN